MSHFDEARVEDQDVWRVPRDVLCGALPLDCTLREVRVPMLVHMQPEFCEDSVRGSHEAGLPLPS
jgi:hypothetical protein